MQRCRLEWHKRDVTEDPGSDAELLTALRTRPELMAVLYERHAEAVYRFLARRSEPAAAEDLLSEVFVAALGARKRVVPHDSGSALPWLYGIAGNVLRRHLRQVHGRWVAAGEAGVDWDAVDARLDAEAQRTRLRAALASLSVGERELLLLVAWEGLTPAEAAEALGIPGATARSRLHRARQRSQHILSTAEDEPAPSGSSALDALTSLLHPEERSV